MPRKKIKAEDLKTERDIEELPRELSTSPTITLFQQEHTEASSNVTGLSQLDTKINQGQLVVYESQQQSPTQTVKLTKPQLPLYSGESVLNNMRDYTSNLNMDLLRKVLQEQENNKKQLVASPQRSKNNSSQTQPSSTTEFEPLSCSSLMSPNFLGTSLLLKYDDLTLRLTAGQYMDLLEQLKLRNETRTSQTQTTKEPAKKPPQILQIQQPAEQTLQVMQVTQQNEQTSQASQNKQPSQASQNEQPSKASQTAKQNEQTSQSTQTEKTGAHHVETQTDHTGEKPAQDKQPPQTEQTTQPAQASLGYAGLGSMPENITPNSSFAPTRSNRLGGNAQEKGCFSSCAVS